MNKRTLLGSSILFLAMALTFNVIAASVRPLGIEHSTSIVLRPDGMYDVTCVDGTAEVKSRADVLGNRVCTHLRSTGGKWTLTRDGGSHEDMRFCDLEATLLRSNTTVVMVQAQFLPPCVSTPVRSQQCNGLICSMQMGNHFYNLDFSVSNKLTLTRMSDNLTGVYTGTNSGGSSGSGNVRTETVGGVTNILQVSNDNGATWKSVCDDSFNETAAAIACTEMGYSGVGSLRIGISVSGDEAYGLDDITCSGSEASIFECRHTPWGSDDCASDEHVQLTCN